MPLNRTDDEEGLDLPNPITRKPSGPLVHLYSELRQPIGLWGFDGVILEVAEPGQQVVSLTLF